MNRSLLLVFLPALALAACPSPSDLDPVPDGPPPVALSFAVETDLETAVSIALLAEAGEGSALTYLVQEGPAHGTLEGVPPEVLYSPDQGHVGADQFTYTVSDGLSTSAEALVSIDVASEWQVVAADGSGDFLEPIEAELQGRKTLIRAGTYLVETGITISSPDTLLRGEDRETVVLRQSDPNYDLLRVYTDNVGVSRLTLDARTHEAQAAFVAADCSNVSLEDSLILGSSAIFAVYFAGPSLEEGEVTLEAVENNQLDAGNRMVGNRVETTWIGDGVSFSLQRDGLIAENEVIGTRIAFYMCRDSVCELNSVESSSSTGIYYSLPAYDNVVRDNIILDPRDSGIHIAPNDEHEILTDHRSTGLLVERNVLRGSRFMGILIEQLADSWFHDNEIEDSDFHGVYMLRSDAIELRGNSIVDAGRAGVHGDPVHEWTSSNSSTVYAEFEVGDSRIEDNVLENTAEGGSQHAVRIEAGPSTGGNFVIDNQLLGEWLGTPLSVDETANTVSGNVQDPG
ncbi:MAG: hypothetical protein GY911_02750 [Actinomycetales bacterium]|nr:hypothetical protein [Actinomycetales bacterium]